MHDGAAVMIEDGVVLVLAAECETGLTALACTVVVRGAQVPAPRPLQQIAAERRHIADLWARRMAGGGSVSCIAFKNDWVVGDVRERDHGAYAYRTVLLLDNLVEPGDAAEIYDAARLQQALLPEVEKVDSARLDDNGILQSSPAGRYDHGSGNSRNSRARRFGFRLRVHPFETLHFVSSHPGGGQVRRARPPALSATVAAARRLRCRRRWQWRARWRYLMARQCRKRRSSSRSEERRVGEECRF